MVEPELTPVAVSLRETNAATATMPPTNSANPLAEREGYLIRGAFDFEEWNRLETGDWRL